MSIETTRARLGYVAEVAAGADNSLEVRFLGKAVAVLRGLAFSPETNSRGDLAYAVGLADGVKSGLGASDIWLNGERIATDRQVLDLAMTDTTLAWLETTATGTTFNRYSLLTHALTVETLAIRGQRVVADGDAFVINGVNATTGNTVVVTAGAAGAAVSTDYGDQSIFLGGHLDDAALVRVTGDPDGRLLYAALDRVLRPDTEEFTGVGNDAGRLAWHQSYRLLALADLALVTGDAELKARAATAVTQILQEADAAGNFPSTRYSLENGATDFSVHSGWIYHAAFQSWDFLSTAQRQSLVEQATRSFDSFESDWMSYGYRFAPGSDFYLDGVVQPFNMQAAMGMLALDLHRTTGEARFLDRAEAVFDLITAELVVNNGTAFWHFWPRIFTDGWSEGTFDSVNAPSHAPSPPNLEDVYHALITMPFLLEAGRALGRNLIDTEALFASIQLGGLNFAAELNGTVGGYEFLPPWPDAMGLWPYLMRELPSVLPHYDQGVFDWMYAGSARRSGVTASTQIVVETLDPQTGQVTGSRTLTGPAEILAYFETNAYARDPVVAGSIDLGTEGNDTRAGTAGPDSVRLLGGNDTAAMGDGHDLVMGDFGDDVLSGDGGDDSLYGGFGADVLNGGAGDDLLSGQADDDVLIGGKGGDSLIGGGGRDTADYSGSTDRIAVNLMTGVGLGGDAHGDRLVGVENLIGTNSSFTDFLLGDDNANAIYGLAGDDELHGLGGDDTLTGGEGADSLYGNDGDDVLVGGAGGDTLTGGDGRDTANYSSSTERIAVNLMTGVGLGGDAHGDRLFGIENLVGTNSSFTDFLLGDDAANAIYGLAGDDELHGLGGDDILTGGEGADSLYGNDGDDILVGGVGGDTLTGGDGRDTADYSGSVERISANLIAGAGVGGDAQGDRLFGIENLIGTNSSFGDFLTGDDKANVIHGLAGNDELSGLGGNDALYGGLGSDVLQGGAGDDLLYGGAGDDVLIGGRGADTLAGDDGRDTADYSTSAERIAVNLMTGAGLGGDAHGDELFGIENLIGTNSSFTDFLLGDDNANAISGLAGDDELHGLGGNDILVGGEGADRLYGNDGDDILVGGVGGDTLTGGDGRDTADYSSSAERIAVNLMTGVGLGGDAHGDQLVGIERLIGTNSSFTDFLLGDDNANAIYGLAGDDELHGLGGDDILTGGEGADSLYGNDGNDALTGGQGNDRIDGGDGYDILIVSGSASQYLLLANGDGFILKGPDGDDTLTRIEAIQFSDGNLLELSGVFGQNADVLAWEDGRISEAPLSSGSGGDEPVAAPDRWSGQALMEEQSLIGDHHGGGGWGADGWTF